MESDNNGPLQHYRDEKDRKNTLLTTLTLLVHFIDTVLLFYRIYLPDESERRENDRKIRLTIITQYYLFCGDLSSPKYTRL